jgi:hypothetical protein
LQTITVTATSAADATKSAGVLVTLMPPAAPTLPSTIRVDAGGAAYTDPSGQVWSADNGFDSGSSYRSNNAIAGTTTPALYQTEHWNNRMFQYQTNIPNGTYTVNLKFAEIYFTQAGQRVFNVSINGQPVLQNFDIVAQAGAGNKAIDKSFTVTVSAGVIAIQFIPVVENPKINAIEIMPAGGTVPPASGTVVRVNSGGGAYTDSTGTNWSADLGFTGGSTYSTTHAIAGTATPALYQTERYNSATLQYAFTVTNGSYTVKLHFAEIYNTAAGQRVFNVVVNGQTVLSNFDVFAAAGGQYIAVDKAIPVNVTNGSVTIQFVPVVSNPKISAIEIF